MIDFAQMFGVENKGWWECSGQQVSPENVIVLTCEACFSGKKWTIGLFNTGLGSQGWLCAALQGMI